MAIVNESNKELSPIYPPPQEVIDAGPLNYLLLSGHARSDGTYKTGDQLRSEYVRRTDELIRQMTEGIEIEDPVTHEKSFERPDAVVYLDKSARPVEWLVRELWPKLASCPGEPTPERPQSFFVNIDREQWVNTIDPEGKGTVDINRLDPTVIRSLRSIFVSPKQKERGLSEDIDATPSILDGKTILIVDEVFSSGRTLTYATKFFQKAFPTTKIAGAYWMGGVSQRGNAQGNADLPVWYKESTSKGRGVGNRDERRSQMSSSRTQRLGAWFLSTGIRDSDPDSHRLRREIKQLARDENVLIEPSLYRSEEDYDERAERFNKMGLKEFIHKKRALGQQKR